MRSNKLKNIISKNFKNLLEKEIIYNEIDEKEIEISLPFLDNRNDYIYIYIKETEKNKFIIHDYGYNLEDLNYKFGRKKEFLKENIENICKRNNVLINKNNHLIINETNKENIAYKIQDMLQTIMYISAFKTVTSTY